MSSAAIRDSEQTEGITMNESGQGVLCGTASGLDRCGSGQAPNVNSREDTEEDVTLRTGREFGKFRVCADIKTHTHAHMNHILGCNDDFMTSVFP